MGSPLPRSNGTVLLASCNEALIRAIRTGVEIQRHLHLEVCRDPAQALSLTQREEVRLVLVDAMQASDHDEPQLWLDQLTAIDLRVATVSWVDPSEEIVVSPLSDDSASDHLNLPLDMGQLNNLIEAASWGGSSRAMDQPTIWQHSEEPLDPFALVVGSGRQDLSDQLHRVVPQDTTLLFTGETGTGKTRLARLIHELSPRRAEPFLVVDCGAISPSLIESEMFGHVKGAFTGADRDRPGKFASAGCGTLFLDEINSLPLPLQAKLLRAVDDRVFEPVGSERGQPLRARFIAATNALLDDEVAAGRFRADLYFRINVVGFYLPPLRDRRDLIAPLANKFMLELAARNRPDVRGMSREVQAALQEYSWPGNIRELHNVIERAVALCAGPAIELHDLPETMRRWAVEEVVAVDAVAKVLVSPIPALFNPTLAQSKEAAEILRIKEVLDKHDNNRLRTATELGISRMGLYKKLHKYGLTDWQLRE